MSILKEVKRLHDMGLAPLWVVPGGKRPTISGWTTGERLSWKELERTYKKGNNAGIRTGAASKIGERGYLCVIDVDIKDDSFKSKADQAVKNLIGDHTLPEVRSGSGGGSKHLYCLTKTPFKMFVVLKEKNLGEVAVYSNGRQMVIPPSRTKGDYIWVNPIKNADSLVVLPLDELAGTPPPSESKEKNRKLPIDDDFKFKVDDSVELGWLDIPDNIREGILSCADINDRSEFLLRASNHLLNAGLSTDEILSVFTNPKYRISDCAYDRRAGRRDAAAWVWEHTLRKAIEQPLKLSPEDLFGDLPTSRKLTFDEIVEQDLDLGTERSWIQDIDRTDKGRPISNIHNVSLILSNEVCDDFIRRDTFAIREAYKIDTPWGSKANHLMGDDDVALIRHWLGQTYDFEPSANVVYDALTSVAHKNAFDPVHDMLEALPTWDGVPRLDTWLVSHFEAEGDPEYLAQVFRKWMMAMVMRVYRPGAKFDWMPIFEGAQGVGKSSFGRVLVGDKYFCDWLPNLTDKDAALGLQGMWCVEMSELSQFRKNELETIKAFVTRTIDKFRPPHGRKLVESARRCVFFGTTNQETYLRDDTGNRRFKPVKVGELDFDRLRKDRDQLFAEAKVYAQRSTELDLELTGTAKVFERKIHGQKMVEDDSDLMRDALENFIENNPEFDLKKFQILDFFGGRYLKGVVTPPLSKWAPNTRNAMFCGKALKKLGAVKRHVGGRVFWKIAQKGEASPSRYHHHQETSIENEKADFF